MSIERGPTRQRKKWGGWLPAWARGTLWALAALTLGAGAVFGARQMQIYSRQTVENRIRTLLESDQGIDLRISFTATPVWMDGELSKQILAEAQVFAARHSPAEKAGDPPDTNYFRLCNPLDDKVLGELARHFTEHPATRQSAHDPAADQRAWIKEIRAIRREGTADGLRQTILIDAEFRKPAAFVAQGNSYYMVDAEGVLLPGEYTEQYRKALPELIAIRLVNESLPIEPGLHWDSPGGNIAIALAQRLANESYGAQIAAINMDNFGALKDPRAPQIKLETVFASAADPSRTTEIDWGRAPGDEKFYEVTEAAKLKALAELFQRFNRIDAGRDYVDVRTEQIRLPRMAGTGGAAPSTEPPSGGVGAVMDGAQPRV